MGSNNRLAGKLLARDGERAQIEVNGTRLAGIVRGEGAAAGSDGTALIRLESVSIHDAAAENAIRLPLSTCMYLGDRWECLFRQPDALHGGLRAYSRERLPAGEYWLQLPPEKLWLF
jgi:iron(III) transport system ATP-binding protein